MGAPELAQSGEPARVLVEWGGLLPRSGHALDLACGDERNSIYLAECGLHVTGVDSSRASLIRARENANRFRLPIDFIQADLTRFQIPANSFDLIICFKYRDPGLYPQIRAALRISGILIYQTYTLEHLRFGGHPRNPDYLLRPGELLKAFGDWQVIFYREEWTRRGMAALVAKKK